MRFSRKLLYYSLRILICVGILSTILAIAQTETATISGEIVDSSGKIVRGASVELQNIQRGTTSTTTTNDAGIYVFPAVLPGEYRVTIRKQGFKQVDLVGVIANVQDHIEQNFRLEIGSVSESVTVSAAEKNMNTTDASVSTVIDRQFVENVPLNGRTFQSLIALTPGVVFTGTPGTQGASSNNNSGGTGQFSVNGQRSDANAFTVDGVSANFGTSPGSFGGSQVAGNIGGTTALGTTQSLASLDAMQEFRVQTSTYSAEYGRQPGGQISIVTRSGTNEFHGLLFDYLRNDVFDANDWFADRSGQPKPPEKQNDFGGTFGGPVVIPSLYNGRNKTFFFFSYEGLRLRLPNFTLTNVPTLCLRGTGSCASGSSPAAAALRPILNAFPIPNGKDLGNGLAEFSTPYSNPADLDATSVRIDHVLRKNWTLFGRYNNVPSNRGTKSSQDLAIMSTTPQHARTVTVGLDGVLSTDIVNELRFNYTSNTADVAYKYDQLYGATPLALSSILPSQYASSSAVFGIYIQIPGMTAPVGSTELFLSNPDGIVQNQRFTNVVDNLSLVAGNHHLKFGIDWRRMMPFAAANTYRVGSFLLSTQAIANNQPTESYVIASVAQHPIFTNFSAYAQDSWSVTRRLNLDFGLRWDVNPAPGDTQGEVPLAVNEINNLSAMQLAPYGRPAWDTTYLNIAPRLGAAYQLSQQPNWLTVLRGGFGVFYDTGNSQGASGLSGPYEYPFNVEVITTPGVTFPLTAANVAPIPLPDPRKLTPPYGSIAVFDPHLKLPYTLGWSVAVEQSLGRDQTFKMTYVGNSGRQLLQERQINLAGINPDFTIIGLTTNSTTSDYNALQLQFQRRLSKGLQALVSYTWSHTLDYDSTDNGTILPVRGNSLYDIRHSFSGALTYDVPMPSANRVLRTAFGHWSLDTSLLARTGLPVDILAKTVTNSADGSLAGVRPNVVSGKPQYIYSSSFPGGREINPAAFSVPVNGQFGNLGRNVLRGLGMWQQDLAAHRDFKLVENLNLQFRAEGFNVYNHPNFGAIQTTLSAANFGQATGMLNSALSGGGSAGKLSPLYAFGGPRSLQFAARLSF